MYVSLYEEDLNNMNETVYGMNEALDQHDINYRGFWQTYDQSQKFCLLIFDNDRFKAAIRQHGSSLSIRRANFEAAVILNSQSGKTKLQNL